MQIWNPLYNLLTFPVVGAATLDAQINPPGFRMWFCCFLGMGGGSEVLTFTFVYIYFFYFSSIRLFVLIFFTQLFVLVHWRWRRNEEENAACEKTKVRGKEWEWKGQSVKRENTFKTFDFYFYSCMKSKKKRIIIWDREKLCKGQWRSGDFKEMRPKKKFSKEKFLFLKKEPVPLRRFPETLTCDVASDISQARFSGIGDEFCLLMPRMKEHLDARKLWAHYLRKSMNVLSFVFSFQ